MNKTIVITGASSGIGKATAKHFNAKGWNVVATMRSPEKEQDLKESATLKLVALDVQSVDSIKKAVDASIAHFGTIDVWLNNAGYGAHGPLEAGTREQIQRQFDVNYFGLIDCIKGILPHFRQKRSGTIINVSSVGGLMVLPLYSAYNSSKFAVEGLTEGLFYELEPLGIKVKLIEPGGIKTEFLGRSEETWGIENLPDYKPFVDQIHAKFFSPEMAKNFGTPEMVAEVIYKAATDGTKTLRYLAGKDAKQFWFIRRWFGYKAQMAGLKSFLGLK
ncbi:MAG: SDR family oxidoreductase [Bacteroidota bacterium]|nr:SDR family oxidoreductase [Bacteroidota bacterium]